MYQDNKFCRISIVPVCPLFSEHITQSTFLHFVWFKSIGFLQSFLYDLKKQIFEIVHILSLPENDNIYKV